jgi:hypothetical protein
VTIRVQARNLDQSGVGMMTAIELLGTQWSGEDWARPLLDQIVRSSDPELLVYGVGLGWMRVGRTHPPAEAVFVLTNDGLGFASAEIELSEHWVALADVTTLDLLEGLLYPLSAIEVQLRGGRSMLVGWTDKFCGRVLEVLQAQVAAELRAETMTPTHTGPVWIGDLDGLGPSGFTEPALSFKAPVQIVAASDSTLPVLFSTSSAEVTIDDSIEVDPSPSEVDDENPFGPSSNPELDAAIEEFFDDSEFSGSASTADSAAEGWPPPYGGVIYHGGLDALTRKRKHVTLALSDDGVDAAASGLRPWSIHVEPARIDSIAAQGPDELMFSHGVRIGTEAAAIVVTAGADLLIFEVPGRNIIGLRQDLSWCAARFSPGHHGGGRPATF